MSRARSLRGVDSYMQILLGFDPQVYVFEGKENFVEMRFQVMA
jgi:hypothetical protein